MIMNVKIRKQHIVLLNHMSITTISTEYYADIHSFITYKHFKNEIYTTDSTMKEYNNYDKVKVMTISTMSLKLTLC